jgi:hypothetical protein
LSFVDSEQALLSDVVNFSPNINGFIDDLNRLTEENQRLKQDYENRLGVLKREIHEQHIKYNCDIDHLKGVNLRQKRKLTALLSRERRNQNEQNVKEGQNKILMQQLKKSMKECHDLKVAGKNSIRKTDMSETAYHLFLNEKWNSGKKVGSP